MTNKQFKPKMMLCRLEIGKCSSQVVVIYQSGVENSTRGPWSLSYNNSRVKVLCTDNIPCKWRSEVQ